MGQIVDRFFLSAEDSALVVIDVQERLCKAMSEPVLEQLTSNSAVLLEAAETLGVPVMVTEQYVKGLGETIGQLADRLGTVARHEKMSFSCCGCAPFMEQMRAAGRRQVVIVGMETHVCVLQTVLELLDAGYQVHVVSDAVMSRAKKNWRGALETMRQAGAVVTVTETVLFQWLRQAGTEQFKQLSRLVR